MMQKTRRWRLPAYIAAAVLAVAMLGIRSAGIALAQMMRPRMCYPTRQTSRSSGQWHKRKSRKSPSAIPWR